MEGSSHDSARAEDAPDWDSLVRRRLPGYLHKEIRQLEKERDRILQHAKNFPTDDDLEDGVTTQDLRDWRESNEKELEEREKAISDPVGWLLGTEMAKRGLMEWTAFPDEESERRGNPIFFISMFIRNVFAVVGVVLKVPDRKNLREYCMRNIHEFRAPIGAADTFGQIGQIWDGFKTKYPNIPDLPAGGPIIHDGIHETVSDRLVTAVMSSLAGGKPR
jgi:hypothetical protein